MILTCERRPVQYRGLVALPEHSAVNIDVISPATEKHVSKHSAQAYRLVLESPQLYARATQPFIEAIPPARLAWVVNILDKKARGLSCPHCAQQCLAGGPHIKLCCKTVIYKICMATQNAWPAPQAEADRLIYEDPDEQSGFMLHPDMKWVCGMRLRMRPASNAF